ncbi:hypothetical protein M3Y98_00751800 [Aphelenchoides besseyi]|nr:hypothetical protein M3Y98_00751800 [Aphelenchoides besseyi]KAI6211561.1 hypothetical protein M3Y96_00447500 [Aphelenchoides besseyi]
MFGRDPFDPFGHMRRTHNEFDQMFGMMNQMDQMMNQMLGSTFGHRTPMMGMLEGAHPNPRHPMAQPPRRDPMSNALGLFGGFGFGGGMMEHVMNDPNSMVFSQSTMITMNPDGTQRVVSNSTRKAGDVKETRSALRDGDNEHISVGHHMGGRSHLIEKKRDRDGRFRSSQKFVNLNEEDAATFNAEFKERANRNLSGLYGGNHSASDGRRAIEQGPSNNSRYSRPSRQHESASHPIITVPDDDEEDEVETIESNTRTTNRRRPDDYVRSNTRNGPTIREISDEEAEQETSKKRRGMFGNFFRANDD